MKSERMRISVVIPLYNKCDSIARALLSVFAQTIQPFEIIIVNDGSTDSSECIVEQIHNPLVRLIHQSNSGVSSARNKGIENAKGNWIVFLDADDEWQPEFLESVYTAFKIRPEYILYGTNFRNINTNKALTKKTDLIIDRPLTLSKLYYNNGTVFSIVSVVVRKTELIRIGGFPLDIRAGEDLITLFKLSFCGKFLILGKSLVNIDNPLPGDRKFRTSFALDPFIENLNNFQKENKDHDLKTYLLFKAFWYKIRSSTYLMNGYNYYSIVYAFKSILLWPFNYKLYIYLILNLLPFGLGRCLFVKILTYKT